MNLKTTLRYAIYLVLGIILLILSVPILDEPFSLQSTIPGVVLAGLGFLFRGFVKKYRSQPPTLLLNMIQLGYIATLVIALYYAIVVIMNLL